MTTAAATGPLDYTLLAAGLADPTVAAIVTARLAPGSGYCTLDHADLPGARAGLEHPEPVIRRHAAIVVGDLIGPMGPDNLDPGLVHALRTKLTELADRDPDGEVRRLAGYRR